MSNTQSHPVTIQTERLFLRQLSMDDTDRMMELFGGENVMRYFPNPIPPDRERMTRLLEFELKHWEEKQCGWWAVELTETHELIGWCGLQYLPETDENEVAYMLGRAYWGKGYATEAASAALQFGLKNMGFKEIVGIVHVDNIASQHVLQKIGLQFTRLQEYFNMPCQRYAISVKS